MSFLATGVAIAGVAVSAYGAISNNSNQKKALNYQMTAEELQAQYERDLSTTQNFEQWSQMQTAQYQTFNQTTAQKNTMVYAASAVVVLVAGVSLVYLLKSS